MCTRLFVLPLVRTPQPPWCIAWRTTLVRTQAFVYCIRVYLTSNNRFSALQAYYTGLFLHAEHQFARAHARIVVFARNFYRSSTFFSFFVCPKINSMHYLAQCSGTLYLRPDRVHPLHGLRGEIHFFFFCLPSSPTGVDYSNMFPPWSPCCPCHRFLNDFSVRGVFRMTREPMSSSCRVPCFTRCYQYIHICICSERALSSYIYI